MVFGFSSRANWLLCSDPHTPAVIFGAGNKLRAGGPYLALLRGFEESLEVSQGLLIVGYSFRHDHVNAILTNWLNSDNLRQIVVLDKSADRFGDIPSDLSARTLGHYLWWLASDPPHRVKFLQATVNDGLTEAIEAARSG